MAEFKLSELLSELDKHLAEGTEAGYKTAILEAHKILEAVLQTKGYPGKTIEQKMYWAGFSLKGKDDFVSALKTQQEISEKLEVQISDFEARETVESYKRVIKVIADRAKLNVADQIKNFFEMYFSPKSLIFYRNLAIFLGFFVIIKILAYADFGKNIIETVVRWADFIISWQFLVIVAVIIFVVWLAQNYFAGKSKVRIKDEVKIKEYEDR